MQMLKNGKEQKKRIENNSNWHLKLNCRTKTKNPHRKWWIEGIQVVFNVQQSHWISILSSFISFYSFFVVICFLKGIKSLQTFYNWVIIFHVKIDPHTYTNMWLWTLFSIFIQLDLQSSLSFSIFSEFFTFVRIFRFIVDEGATIIPTFIRLNVAPWINCFQFRAIDNNGTHSSSPPSVHRFICFFFFFIF